MLNDYAGVLNLNEDDINIRSLTHSRPLACIPIGGRYRIIDFILSNMVNAGIQNVGIFMHGNARSLMDHVGSGKPWDLNRKINGLFVFNFGGSHGYVSDIELFRENMEYFYQSRQNNVIISPSYMICNMDLEKAVEYHEQSGKDITIVYKKINDGKKRFIDCDVLNLDSDNSVMSVGKNMGMENENNISMEIFIMKKQLLIDIISRCVRTGYYNSLKEAIYKNVAEFSTNAFEFKGYLQCINSIDVYYKTNMDLLNLKINRELFYKNGLIYTKVKDESPTKYSSGCSVKNSLIANGCIIEGDVENSVIFRRVRIKKGAVVKNCIIMQNTVVEENAKLENVIIDKNADIEKMIELKGHKEIPLVIEKRSLV